jgi:hypothetical protein
LETKIAFREQSKTITAEVIVESDTMTGDEVLAEAKRLFDLAFVYSRDKSLRYK